LVADYLAIGVDPAKATIFGHSQVPTLNQLMLPLLSSSRSPSWRAIQPSRTSSRPPGST
jgi:tryptophanyl-tRNA synthetase